MPLSNRRRFLQISGFAGGFSLAGSLAQSDDRKPVDVTDPRRHPLLITEHPTIRSVRDAALQVLKPSQRDLEHGLALHQENVVFDSYGFAPQGRHWTATRSQSLPTKTHPSRN